MQSQEKYDGNNKNEDVGLSVTKIDEYASDSKSQPFDGPFFRNIFV